MEGTPFGRYRLVDLLGRGGMGEVWRAFDTVTERVVALKVLPVQFADDELFQQRFRREARSAAGLDEPHVVPIFDYGEIDGRLFVTMRLIKGEDLQTVIDRGPLPPMRAVGIIEQIASALHAAHRIELVHRDVKPSNILIAEDDFAYLIDFGIARAAGETGLTNTGATIGTWAYMAPERFEHGTANVSVDIYALTCVLHQALTGQLPFPGRSLEQIAVAHMTKPPPKPSLLRFGVPDAMDTVIATGMAKNPDQRYPTTRDLAAAARAALVGRAAEPYRPSPTRAQSVGDDGPIPARLVAPPPGHADTNAPDKTRRPLASSTQLRPDSKVSSGGLSRNAAAQKSSNPAPARAASSRAVKGAGRKTGQTNLPSNRALPPSQQRARANTSPQKAAVKSSKLAPNAAPSTSRGGERRWIVVAGVVAAVLLVVTVLFTQHPATTLTPSPSPLTTTPMPVPDSRDALSFTGLNRPFGVAVDAEGGVYVTDPINNRVLKLAAGSTTQEVVPFTELNRPSGVAVDHSGSVYVTDQVITNTNTNTNNSANENGRVLKLGRGSTSQEVVPFADLKKPSLVAVDGDGSVYVSDVGANAVLKLAAGSTSQEVLPFTGLKGPVGVAVDGGGSVFVADSPNDRVLKLAAGSSTQDVLPFAALSSPAGVALDAQGSAYVSDTGEDRVLKLPTK